MESMFHDGTCTTDDCSQGNAGNKCDLNTPFSMPKGAPERYEREGVGWRGVGHDL